MNYEELRALNEQNITQQSSQDRITSTEVKQVTSAIINKVEEVEGKATSSLEGSILPTDPTPTLSLIHI